MEGGDDGPPHPPTPCLSCPGPGLLATRGSLRLRLAAWYSAQAPASGLLAPLPEGLLPQPSLGHALSSQD